MPEVESPPFKVSDLPGIAPSLVECARAGVAKLEDLDGTTFAVLRDEKLAALNAIVRWATQLLLVELLLRKPASDRAAADFDEQPWLAVFSDEDLAAFVTELRDALLVAAREGSSGVLEGLIHDWRVTAAVLADDERREILLGHYDQSDFVEVARPG